MARRRQRAPSLPVPQSVAGRAFSFRENEPIGAPAGEDLVASSTGSSVPRGGVRRLFELDSQVSSSYPWGMGGRLPPITPAWGEEEFRRVLRRPLGRQLSRLGAAPRLARAGDPRRSVYPFRLLQNLSAARFAGKSASRGAADWAAFRKLPALDHRTRVCVSRRVRRGVLFAFNVAGKRGLGRGGVRRSVDSSYGCR